MALILTIQDSRSAATEECRQAVVVSENDKLSINYPLTSRTKVLIACTYMYTNDCSDAFNDHIVDCKFSAMEDQ